MIARAAHLRLCTVTAAVLLPVAGVTGAVLAGPAAAIAVAAGVLFAAASFALSALAVSWAAGIGPQLVMPVGLATYAAKFGALGVLLLVAGDALARFGPSFGAGIVASALLWVSTQAWWVWHARIPVLQFPPAEDPAIEGR